MQIDLDPASGNYIRSFSHGEIRISEKTFRKPVIVSAEVMVGDWSPPPIAQLSIADFSQALALQPEVLLFGTGKRQHFPSTVLITEVMKSGVGFEIMDTAAACRTFNVLSSESRAVVAALLLE